MVKDRINAAQFNASFPSYDGIWWAKAGSLSRTTEKMLFVSDRVGYVAVCSV
jgi:hypothetical protein